MYQKNRYFLLHIWLFCKLNVRQVQIVISMTDQGQLKHLFEHSLMQREYHYAFDHIDWLQLRYT